MERCIRCLAPIIDVEQVICNQCKEMPQKDILEYNTFQERKIFFESHKDEELVFAFSGGADSVVSLALLIEECKKYGINYHVFTVDTGVKGVQTWENIKNIIHFFKIEKLYEVVDVRNLIINNDVTNQIIGNPISVIDLYRYCVSKNILCCGKICNSILDSVYMEILKKYKTSYLLTGGDTLKKNSQGKYSIIWNKKPGLNIVRMGAGFGLTKEKVRNYIKKHELPWINPKCGGYDTDCLIPGYFFKNASYNQIEGADQISKNFPVVGEYIYERVRFGVIPYEEGKQLLNKLDVSSTKCYQELEKIIIQ